MFNSKSKKSENKPKENLLNLSYGCWHRDCRHNIGQKLTGLEYIVSMIIDRINFVNNYAIMTLYNQKRIPGATDTPTVSTKETLDILYSAKLQITDEIALSKPGDIVQIRYWPTEAEIKITNPAVKTLVEGQDTTPNFFNQTNAAEPMGTITNFANTTLRAQAMAFHLARDKKSGRSK